MKRSMILALIAGLVLASCGGGGDENEETEGALEPCTEAPVTMDGQPALPPGFPTPDGVIYTSSEPAGPSQIVEGFYDEVDIDEGFVGYKEAFEGADYDILDEEQELHDAEMVFSGGDATGQVKLIETCEGRTSVTITVRPN